MKLLDIIIIIMSIIHPIPFFSREKSPDKNTINFVFIKSYKSTCLFCPFFLSTLLSLSFNSTCKRDQMDSQKKSMWIFVTKRAFTITLVIFHTDIHTQHCFCLRKCNELWNLVQKAFFAMIFKVHSAFIASNFVQK